MPSKRTLLKLTLALACFTAILWLGVGCQDPDYQCGTKSLERANKTEEVFDKYRPLLVRYPDRIAFKKEFLRDEQTGDLTDEWGLIIIVSDLIDEKTLPPNDRIPDELEGVPIQIITEETYVKSEIMRTGFPSKKDPHVNLAYDVRERNRDLFRRNPFYKNIGYIVSQPGSTPGNRITAIEIVVSDQFDQSTLPSEQIIPPCLDDVPIKFILVPD